jgi:hypothetical protein
MRQKAWTTILEIMGLALLAFTATRTIDLFGRIFEGESLIVAVFALAALDIGLVAWTQYYIHGAKSDAQRAIALIMVVVDMAGVAIVFISDMMIRGGKSGLVAAIDQGTGMAIIVALGIVIMANIMAFIMVKVADPDAQIAHMQNKARYAIDRATMEQIASKSEQLASELAPKRASQWTQNTRDNVMAETDRNWGSGQQPQPAQVRSMAAQGEAAPKAANSKRQR